MSMNVESLSREQLVALVSKMQADSQRKLSFKVTAAKPDGSGTSGAISLYGLGRFPVTLYAGQWERVAEEVTSGRLAAFIKANDAIISRK